LLPRLAILTSHPIQYYAPLFRELAQKIDLHVFFAHRATPAEQGRAGFSTAFEWDVDLTSGYEHSFLQNRAKSPGTDHFFGCDTRQIGEHLREGRFNVLLVTGWHLKTYLQGLFAAKRLGIPVMVRGDSQLGMQRSLLKTAVKALCYPSFLRQFDAALYVGERSRAYLRHYGFPSSRQFFSPHCVDTKWFAARATPEARALARNHWGIRHDAKVVLFAGKLIPIKRPLDVVAATAQLKSKGMTIEFIVAGSGPLENAIREQASALGVRIHMLGFQNQTLMPNAYAASDLLVLPSISETWGMVANEALACGRPIVVSDAVGCAPDLIGDSGVGRVFPMGNTAALVDAIAAVFRDPPSSECIRRQSDAYSVSAAITGILNALAFLKLEAKCLA
jgi:glycosyltransferase involved in cell wall biosynthesis